jgi:hypothetical protein
MGRKDSKQRVKGNLSPATSSRSQDIISSDAFNSQSFNNQSFNNNNIILNNQPIQLKLILSALQKKDIITRIKALEDLISYFNSNQINQSIINDFIIIWVNIITNNSLHI